MPKRTDGMVGVVYEKLDVHVDGLTNHTSFISVKLSAEEARILGQGLVTFADGTKDKQGWVVALNVYTKSPNKQVMPDQFLIVTSESPEFAGATE